MSQFQCSIMSSPWWRPPCSFVVLFWLIVLVKATVMPLNHSHRLPHCQTANWLFYWKKYEGWRKKDSRYPWTEISKQIHNCIRFQKWQDRFEVWQIVSPTPGRRNTASRNKPWSAWPVCWPSHDILRTYHQLLEMEKTCHAQDTSGEWRVLPPPPPNFIFPFVTQFLYGVGGSRSIGATMWGIFLPS